MNYNHLDFNLTPQTAPASCLTSSVNIQHDNMTLADFANDQTGVVNAYMFVPKSTF